MLDGIMNLFGAHGVQASAQAGQQDAFKQALELTTDNDTDDLGISSPNIDFNSYELRRSLQDGLPSGELQAPQGLMSKLFSDPQFMKAIIAMIQQKLGKQEQPA